MFKLHCAQRATDLFTSSSNRSIDGQHQSLLHTSHYYIVDRNMNDFHEESNEAHHKEA